MQFILDKVVVRRARIEAIFIDFYMIYDHDVHINDWNHVIYINQLYDQAKYRIQYAGTISVYRG